jgi:hypothetical protein
MSVPQPAQQVPPSATVTSEPRWLEPVSALLLGLAAVLTAVAAYLSSVQSGDEDEARARSIDANARAYSLTNAATQTRAADQAMFAAWAEAGFDESAVGLAEYLTTLMRPELQTAIAAWSETPDEGGPDTPFEMAEYVIPAELEADEARAEGAEQDDVAQAAAEKGDGYDKSTIYLALALFFAGIATTFRRRTYAGTLLAVSAVAVVVGAVQLLMA